MEHGILNGIIIEGNEGISLLEPCQICKIDTEWVTVLVHEGIIKPVGVEPEHWFFSGIF